VFHPYYVCKTASWRRKISCSRVAPMFGAYTAAGPVLPSQVEGISYVRACVLWSLIVACSSCKWVSFLPRFYRAAFPVSCFPISCFHYDPTCSRYIVQRSVFVVWIHALNNAGMSVPRE
jgi:hypothetical protein